MNEKINHHDVIVVGAGFTGLTAALELARAGKKVLVLEADSAPGGLAGSFEFRDGVRIEKFYHHWFNNDEYVPELVHELGLDSEIVTHPSRTGMYFNGRQWRLSTPLDLLRFKPLSLLNRIRLGLLVFQVRRVKDWRTIEHLSIREWLEPLCGNEVFRIVWEPLIRSKFSIYADQVNAVWFWKKLVLRGSTRDKRGGEELVYFRGGFGRLAEAIQDAIRNHGGEIRYGKTVKGLRSDGNELRAVTTENEVLPADQFVFTPALPIIANIFDSHVKSSVVSGWRRVNYLGNVCLVLELDRSLSDTYWLNVNDAGFPFVGVIEHTNFDPPDGYDNKHIVFLSRYLATNDPLWNSADPEYLEFALSHLKRMFPMLDRSWILDFRIWRAEYAQPVTERNYSQYVPDRGTPFTNAHISTMAHIYPEDRGTNYAIREGRSVAQLIR
ncbi:MAG TPA: NAD(P)/FAD-dependent oxidoreductase [Dokdonella sp.]|nr:NAD(P)/FAD-dependent oxidoreductase [Dokdonella sp.]